MKKFLAILIAVFALAGCDDAPKSDKPVVKIALLYPMSGDAAIYGDSSRKVVDNLFKSDMKKLYPNQKYHYEFIFEDVQLTAQKAAIAMQKVATTDKVDAVLSILSNQALVINPIAEKNKILQLSYTMDARAADGNYNYQLSVDSAKAIALLLDNIKNPVRKKYLWFMRTTTLCS